MMAILLAICFILTGCGVLGDQPVSPPPAMPTVADIAQVPPTVTSLPPSPTPPPPTLTLKTPRIVIPTVTPQALPSVPTITPQGVPTSVGDGSRAIIREDGRVYLGGELLLDPAVDVGGCFDPGQISYSPTEEHFVVVLACFEGDNHAFIFREDGSEKRQITGPWDFVSYYEFEWSDDGQKFIYQRIDSCCAEPPADAPPPGRVSYNVESGEKVLLDPAVVVAAPTAPPPTAVPPPPTAVPEKLYRVIDVASNDVLNIRSGPGVSNGIIGTIPYNGTDVRIIGGGTSVSGSLWVPIQYMGVTGWVNSRFLDEQ